MKPTSIDLRKRIVAARLQDSQSMRQIAERFGIAKGTVQNIIERYRDAGTVNPKPANVAGLTLAGAIAPMVLDGAMDRLSFEAYVTQSLIPALPPGAIVIMDNLGAHQSVEITHLIENAGATLWYLPPYSPDYNPIEQMGSKVKTIFKRVCARTQDALGEAIALALDAVSPEDSQGFFRHCSVGVES